MRRRFALLGSSVLSSAGLVLVIAAVFQVRTNRTVSIALIALGLAVIFASALMMILTYRSRGIDDDH